MKLRKAKVYRDPVHDIISFKEDGLLGAMVGTLIDTPEVQRLRHVRQLGMAHLVFHGAEHSRFQHSIGVAHLARRFGARLGESLDEDQRLVTVAAALLHDIGHAPFSHVMERVFGFSHEEFSEALILDPDTGVYKVLAGIDPTLPERVAARMAKRDGHFSGSIVSSQLDADRCDYLLRDAHMTGVQVGRYDLERIVLMLDHDELGLLVDERAWEAVEGYLIARYHMYRLVYYHRAVRSAESMLQSLFARARRLIEDGQRDLLPSHALGALMRQEQPSPVAYARLGDFHAWAMIDAWRDHADPILRRLATGLLERRLLKVIERPIESPESAAEDDEAAQRVREALSESEQHLFAVDEAGDTPYQPYPALTAERSSIRIRMRSGRVERIEELSPVVRALSDAAYKFRRWFVHPDIDARVRRILSGDDP